MKVIVVGAGPSGLIASWYLANKNHEVILLEKNDLVGKKIYLTGKGRCNLTNMSSQEDFFENIVSNPKFFYSAFSTFSNKDVYTFFENNNVPLVLERGNRVFPASYQAKDIAECLGRVCLQAGVQIKYREEVKSIYKNNDTFSVVTNKQIYSGDVVLISTGGKSYSFTGSTGDGYDFAKSLGHSVIEPVAALSAFKIAEKIPYELYKFTLKNVELNVKTSKKHFKEFGEITLYKEGVAGAITLTISSSINREKAEDVSIFIDLKPALSFEQLEKRIIREIQSKICKNVGDLLGKLLPKEFISWFVDIANIDVNEPLVTLSKESRTKLITWLKQFRLTYKGLDDIERAVVTAGGVSTKEINPKTMESKIVNGLYFAGEVIDIDALTGGFNMQIALSTGYLAAKAIHEKSL